MKKVICFILTVVMLITPMCLCSAALAENEGTDYYIDAVNGDDMNSGTSEAEAWKTLSAASEKIYAPGDRILLKAGSIFDGAFNAQGDGTAEAPVVFSAYGDVAALGKPMIRSDGDEAVLLTLHNISGWVVENIEFSAPNGSGIYITADGGTLTGCITVRDCTFHEIWNKQCSDHNGSHCPIYIKSSGRLARIRNIRLQNCDIYDCAFGIKMGGLSREMTPDRFVSPEESYNSDFLLEGISLHNILYDAIMICSVNGMTIRNCSLINTSIRDDYYCAPIWSHHACNYVVENCEIAGATNEKDGMAIDFDGWTTDATYQYIYSHDNVRFINSCCYDNYTKNSNCTVRYCLSVNDNKQENSLANLLYVKSMDYAEDEYPTGMDGFKFYNNTLINCSGINCAALSNSVIANNIFVGKDGLTSVQCIDRAYYSGDNFLVKFSGEFTNNCFWNMGVPECAKNSFICDPKFVGSDESSKYSYILSSKSKLLDKGIQAEGYMGAHDFFGNALREVHNIGCYEGAGEAASDSISDLLIGSSNILAMLSTVFSTMINRISAVFTVIWPF